MPGGEIDPLLVTELETLAAKVVRGDTLPDEMIVELTPRLLDLS